LVEFIVVNKGKGSCNGNGANAKYGCYQILGELQLDWKTNLPIKNYQRILRLDQATAFTSFKQKL